MANFFKQLFVELLAVLTLLSPHPTQQVLASPLPLDSLPLTKPAFAPIPTIMPLIINEKLFAEMHNAKPPDLSTAILPIPYLTLPFRRADVEKNLFQNRELYTISQGFLYSTSESEVHHVDLHSGIDYAVPYGTPIVAPADGYVVSSYNTVWHREKDGKQGLYRGRPIRRGLGYFVYLYVPQVHRIVGLAHLSEINPDIPFFPPLYNKSKDDWVLNNTIHKITFKDIEKNPNLLFVQKGTWLGNVGNSGLGLGDTDYQPKAPQPAKIPEGSYISWDIPHVHMEEFYFTQDKLIKGWKRDPYGIYNTKEYYPTHDRIGKIGKDTLFLLDSDGLPQFAQ